LGLIFITKATAYLMAGVVVVGVLIDSFIRANNHKLSVLNIRRLAFSLMVLVLPALMLGGIWWLRNFSVYGFPDFLGLRAHDAVVVGQLRTADYIAQLGSTGAYLGEAARITFYSFWGMFGWQALPLVGATVGWVYPAVGVLVVVAVLGWGITLARRENDPANRGAWLVLGLTVVLAVAQYVYYNTAFVQFQGRYLFVALIPFSLWLNLGLDAWRRMLLGRWAWSRWVLPLAWLLLAIFDVWLLWRVIVPNLTPLA
ncbi:MAG: hypothetical protein H7Y11_11030, partial [Armatimonadetes bacterium]|nr:hypothetical protein [Anaerolineae bacterium]